MTAGYILIFVMLVLGGVIATVSDRLGTKVGKARLSLFKLRPRDTAVVVTVMAGSILSAITLGILFATSKPLRTGVFSIDEIQKRLNNARREIKQATQEKNRVETELAQALAAQSQAKANLEQINQSLQAANAEQAKTQTKLNSLRAQLNSVQAAKSKTEQQLSQVEAAKSQTEEQLATVEAAKSQTEEQLKLVETARSTTRVQLDRTENQLKTVSGQKTTLSSEIAQLQAERQQLIEQREQVKTQIAQRDKEIAQREAEITKRNVAIVDRNKLIAERDKEIAQRAENLAQRDRIIVERDKVIAEREALLETLGQQQAQLEQQQTLLQQQMQVLERDFQAIREGTVAIRRGQILAAGVVRIQEAGTERRAIDRLLQEANKTTVELMQPENNKVREQVIQITKAEIDQLISQIKDGKDYVVRIVAGANYLRQEKVIKVFAEAEINRVVFRAGDVIAGVAVDPVALPDEQVRQQLQQLIEACQFRARLIGVVGGRVQVADNRIETLGGFVDRLQQYDKPLEVRAIAADVTYIAGPLKIDLVALSNGVVVFRTGQQDPGRGDLKLR
ncbi:MAG: DUF3084 domain-containing protein [Microcoleus sp. PH2017_25_DOB_D_A]|uniref:DUF3084 domain-containing protein n=1 Tax=unclassified Microcoleus TaxID=2642155 RepID=UPI001DB7A0BD|nr:MULTISPECIES: DUF3084 domain-containing protein [unclassified Microcoleus]TAE16372.1 MAG: DUF3084 domain-containing protein [Oscillatoriales cyanobacterium]MCC3496205.1 DUF3084 domain-containing protein [Microcoleus sp. PH2017_15_JOR_U_A]MCC3533668.1 DUF3084 domain-containing protein [Microcoleus sp. PH2017_25_DOB_D_A]MCC3545839.1 DUF3084 domain-containing protein [Microcoleus sp. PH2017_24_DOB_U_A]TAE20787.1 MAG: DUF3084 domain-containing protein [Oscillatoriales cyanobacterium]